MIRNNWLKNKPIAHRGLWNGEIPENSLLAFEKAVEKKYPIELDVQMLKDGTLVVFHDWMLDRMTKKQGKLSTKKWDDILNTSLLETQCTIPQLRNVLEIIDGRVPLIIEMKNKDHERLDYIENFLSVLQTYSGEFVLSSFDPFLVKVAKERFGNVLCGQNFSDYKHKGVILGWLKKYIMYILWMLSNNVPDFFVCEAVLLPRCWIVGIAKKRNIPLLTWGIKDVEEYVEKKSYIDNYIFDGETYE